MPQELTVSVVLATHNRAERLERVIGCLGAQSLSSPFEVVVVDDASTDATPEVVRRLRGTTPFMMRAIRLEENGGPAVARNAGWRAASAPLVAFTDDDCMPEPTWLESLVDGLAHVDIAQGMTIIDPRHVRDIGPFGHTVEVLRPTGFYETCNIAYRRAVLEQVGGFDEAFRLPYGEDTDLAWRAKKDGARTAFVPAAVVRHDVRPSSFAAHMRQLHRREGLVMAIQRHPELRRTYPAGVFFSPTHPWAIAWAVAAGLTVARPTNRAAWLALAAASAGHARVSMRVLHGPARRRHWPVVLPLALLADLAEIATLAKASARYRTFFV